eukprot:COSAG01_NODE_1153_length_11487_cov_98.298736_6_plen_55_part_00
MSYMYVACLAAGCGRGERAAVVCAAAAAAEHSYTAQRHATPKKRCGARAAAAAR